MELAKKSICQMQIKRVQEKSNFYFDGKHVLW